MTKSTKEAVTLAMLQAQAAEQVKAEDTATDMLHAGAAGTAEMLKSYLIGQGLDIERAKGTETLANACDALKAGFRSQYCNRQRYTGSKAERKPVNMELARMVLDSTEQVRANWQKDSTEKKIWDAILADARNKLNRVTEIIWPKESSGSESGKKKAPTADSILANIDAFLEANKGNSALVNNFFDQVMARRKK